VDLSRRELLPELMDDPTLDGPEHDLALRGLERINRWSGSARILWPGIRDIARQLDRPLRVLDVATGGGDVPIALARRAARSGISLCISGCDFSNQALDIARKNSLRTGVTLELFNLDVLREAIPSGYDVITTSLFLHHLGDSDGKLFLRQAGLAAGRALLVNDLVRHLPAYWWTWAGTRILSRSHIVHADGPLSVQAAYNIDEVVRLAAAAGLGGARVERRWPFRFLLTWIRS
jgi:2-polyprenyl-3-methyl-5-hydroxy-6-metoxy-1,4-benzoquinol methylase